MTSITFALDSDRRPTTRLASSSSAFAHVEVYAEPAAAAAAWRELEQKAPCSIYQTRAFLLPWVATLGRKAKLEPMYVVARDCADEPVALLTLGVRKRGPFRVATWLGGKDANFNVPLLRDASMWTRAEIERLLRQAARACGPRAPDVFELANQPHAWSGVANAFALLPLVESPSAAYGASLPPTAEALFVAKLSKETRKKLRKKEAKLASFGPVSHKVAVLRDEQTAMIDAFLAQKTARFRARGITSEFDAPEMRAFIETASAPAGAGIELHALCVGERIVAVYGGAAHGGQWSGMFNSFDADEEIAKTSPGDLLLMRIMAACCAAGISRFDLGIGAARYKAALCDEPIPLFDAVVPINVRGRVYAAAARTRQNLKRQTKQNARLMSVIARLRAMRA